MDPWKKGETRWYTAAFGNSIWKKEAACEEEEEDGALLSRGSMIAQHWPVKARIRWRSSESIFTRLFSVK